VNVAVVGAGNGGLAIAAHAGLAGHDVRVLDVRPESLRAIDEAAAA
jgi:3-hydroxyacyl-CoA dehydrogenase